MRKDHFQLYDSLRGLGLSFAITIAVGLFVAFILRDGTSVDLPLIGIASAMCIAITFISFLIWALVNGIHSHQFLRLYHLGGLSRKESFRRVWLYSFAAFLFAGLFMAVVASPLSFAVDDLHSVLIMPVAFLGTVIAGLLVNAIGQLFAMMVYTIPSKLVAGISIALAAFLILALLDEEVIPAIVLGIIAFVLDWFLFVKRRCPLGSTKPE